MNPFWIGLFLGAACSKDGGEAIASGCLKGIGYGLIISFLAVVLVGLPICCVESWQETKAGSVIWPNTWPSYIGQKACGKTIIGYNPYNPEGEDQSATAPLIIQYDDGRKGSCYYRDFFAGKPPLIPVGTILKTTRGQKIKVIRQNSDPKGCEYFVRYEDGREEYLADGRKK